MNDYQEVFESKVCGIPCQIAVINYLRVEGSYSYHAASDLDYSGYTELDWELLDRKGYRAKWLEKKLTDYDTEMIENSISKHFKNLRDDDCY